MIYSKEKIKALEKAKITDTFSFISFPKPITPKKNNRPHKVAKNAKFKVSKKVSRKSLVRKLDKLVSQIVIKRDGGKCVVCGSSKQLGAGHLFSRSHYSTRWDLTNVFCQCWACNFRHKIGDPLVYYNWFWLKFNRNKFETLYNRWKTVKKFSNKDLEQLYERLKKT